MEGIRTAMWTSRAALVCGFMLIMRPDSTAARTSSVVAPNVLVSHDAFLAHSEPSVAVNPVNGNILVAGSKMFTSVDHYRFKVGTYYSSNAGKTWTDNGPLPGFSKFNIVSDVSFAFSPDGSVAYAATIATARGENVSGVFVSRSLDSGLTWGHPTQVFGSRSGSTFNDKPWVTVDRSASTHRGSVYVAWNLDAGKHWNRYKPRVGIAVARSTDNAGTFSPPAIVFPFNSRQFAIGATPAVGPNGHVSVVFLTYLYTAHATYHTLDLVQSTDGGTFERARTIVRAVRVLHAHLPHSTFRNLSLPAFAVSLSTGAMVVAWADRRSGHASIFKATSQNAGWTWSVPSKIDHRADALADQFQPALAVAGGDTFVCSWFDRRFDPTGLLIDTVVSASSNHGRTFGRPVRVTEHSWDPNIDAPKPEGKSINTFIGDYQGIAADERTVHPLWNDTQDGSSQQIRTASLSLSSLLTAQH